MIAFSLDLSAICNENCKCSKSLFQPVCAYDGKSNYFSPCYAGCKQYDKIESVLNLV